MSVEDPTLEELRLLSTLGRVCAQHMSGGPTSIDHSFMGAGERATNILEEYGLLIPDGRGGSWTLRGHYLHRLDVDEGNFAEVRARYGELSDRELFVPPDGYRGHLPDVQLGFLRLWFPSRAAKKYEERPLLRGRGTTDPNRLDVEFRLDPVDASMKFSGEILTVSEVQAFRDRLWSMHERSERRARLLAYKECIEIDLEAAPDGKIDGKITVRNPIFEHFMTSRVRTMTLYHLQGTIAGFDRVLEKFPQVDSLN